MRQIDQSGTGYPPLTAEAQAALKLAWDLFQQSREQWMTSETTPCLQCDGTGRSRWRKCSPCEGRGHYIKQVPAYTPTQNATAFIEKAQQVAGLAANDDIVYHTVACSCGSHLIKRQDEHYYCVACDRYTLDVCSSCTMPRITWENCPHCGVL